jgi:hypothetical protein
MKTTSEPRHPGYPSDCTGDANCTNARHRAYARLMNALAEAQEAAEAIEELPVPSPYTGPRKNWFLDENETHDLVLEEVAGLLWTMNYIVSSIESATLECCHSEASRRKWREDVNVVPGPQAGKGRAEEEDGPTPTFTVLARR